MTKMKQYIQVFPSI